MLALTIVLPFPRGNLGIDVAGYLAHREPHLESIWYVCAEVSDHDRWQHLSPKWGRKARALLHLTLTTSERDMSERDDDCAVSAGESEMGAESSSVTTPHSHKTSKRDTSERDDDCAVSAGLSFTTSEKDDDCAVSAGQYSSSTTLTHETDISSASKLDSS